MRGRQRVHDLKGKVFGRLTVLKAARFETGRAGWLCKCSCKAKTKKIVGTSNLLHGMTSSCGCLKTEQMQTRFRKHGHARSPELKTPTYISWRNIVQRVDSDRPKDYRWYKAKGIKLCDRWRGPQGYENFLADVGERPTKEHSIDRIDSDGNYEPGNCRWATKKEQVANRKFSK